MAVGAWLGTRRLTTLPGLVVCPTALDCCVTLAETLGLGLLDQAAARGEALCVRAAGSPSRWGGSGCNGWKAIINAPKARIAMCLIEGHSWSAASASTTTAVRGDCCVWLSAAGLVVRGIERKDIHIGNGLNQVSWIGWIASCGRCVGGQQPGREHCPDGESLPLGMFGCGGPHAEDRKAGAECSIGWDLWGGEGCGDE